MIDIKFIRNNPEAVKELCSKRGFDVDVERLISVDKELNAKKTELDQLRGESNRVAATQDREKGKEIKIQINKLKELTDELLIERDKLWAQLPNLLAEDTPDGKDDSENVELRKVGEMPKFDFEPKTHDVIGADLDILDLQRGTKVAAAGYYYWKGDGARLVWAIYRHAMDMLVERGFELMLTPIVAKKQTFFGTGYLPFGEEDLYKLEKEELYLIGTSEQTLVSYHDDEILQPDTLPRLYTAFTPCFRTEAGSYGRKSKGAFRVHQFHKVEQIIFCRPEESEKWHMECQKNVEDFMQSLELPYRVVRVCIGDMGAPGYKKYDVEGWFSGFQEYRETHSNTNLLDFQTRRLNTRCKEEGNTFYPHTISSTMVTDRAALAIIENNQQADGSVIIPKVLRKYMNGQEKIVKKLK
ncbi:MAG: serine--tRNA ligase [Deltaproteobacteria bacterium]